MKILGNEIIRNGRQWGRDNRASKNLLVRLMIRSLKVAVKGIGLVKRLFFDKQFRVTLYMKVVKSKRLQQTPPLTAMNRYPVIFSGCHDYFEAKENIKILSYGCSLEKRF